MRFFLVSLGLVSLLYVSSVIGAQDTPKVILEGNFDCKTGKVDLSAGELAKQEFANLDAALAALNRVYREEGISKLAEPLKYVCEEKEEGAFKPSWESGQLRSALHPRTESLLTLKKKGELVTFTFVEVEGDGAHKAVSHYFRAMGGDEKQCRPISSVCWKCKNGRIICSTPKVTK
jgi:hypothetical protein